MRRTPATAAATATLCTSNLSGSECEELEQQQQKLCVGLLVVTPCSVRVQETLERLSVLC